MDTSHMLCNLQLIVVAVHINHTVYRSKTKGIALREKERQAEFETQQRLGMRWAAFTAFNNDLIKKKVLLPSTILKELRVTRTVIASGCYSTCDVTCTLDKIKRNIVPVALSYGEKYDDEWLFRLGTVMTCQTSTTDMTKLLLIELLIQNGEFLRCICK